MFSTSIIASGSVAALKPSTSNHHPDHRDQGVPDDERDPRNPR